MVAYTAPMTLDGLEYIYAIYQERSFSKAAQRLYITQPALSNKVKKVEERLKTPLFDRSTNPIRLTPAGEAYIKAAKQIMAVEKEFEEELHALSTERSGSITIGSSAFFCAHVLPELAAEFQEKHPGYMVNLLEGNTDDLTQCLHSGVVDFTLDVDNLDTRIFIGRPWRDEHILLAVPAHRPVNERLKDRRLSFEDVRSGRFFDKDCPRTGLEHFAGEDFLLLKKGNDIHQRALKMCGNAGFKPRIKMYLDQMLTSYYVADNGHGAAFIRSAIARYVKNTDRLFFYKLDDDNVMRTVLLYSKRDARHTSVADDFIAFMNEMR